MITLDLSHQVLATPAVQTRVLKGSNHLSTRPSVLRQILHALLTFFAATYDTVFGLSSGPPLHDPLAVAVVISSLNPAFAEKHPTQALRFDDNDGERFTVGVVTDGHHGPDVSVTGQLGRTIAAKKDGLGIAIPRGVDLAGFWDVIMDCIERADQRNAQRLL